MKMKISKVTTIGVYGCDEATFFKLLVRAKVDTFCDIRSRRGMRGSKYSFVNSTYLQDRLHKLGIRYFHFKELAPSEQTRAIQKKQDSSQGVLKRDRAGLDPAFVRAYQEECLSQFQSTDFLNSLPPDAEVITFFCVEASPEACHRSLIAERLSQDQKIQLEHLTHEGPDSVEDTDA